MTIGFRIGRLFSCFVFVAVLSGSADVQVSSETPTDVSAVLEAFRARHQTPGMVALVLRGDRIIATGAVGVRREHSAERVTLEDVFHLGSCTKAMTATLAAMIVEEGRIGWETTLGAVFGNTVKNMARSWRDVTLRQTLAHRAGFRSGNDLWGLLDRRVVEATRSDSELRQMLVANELSAKPESTPGTRESYSNVGFIVVGAALEKITGRTWEDLIRDRLFKPLGISTGGFGAPGTPGKIDQPWGHDDKGEAVDPGASRSDLPRYAGPAGTVHMSIGDWAKFVGLHLRGDSANPHRRVELLKPGTFEELHRLMPGGSFSGGWGFDSIDLATLDGSRRGVKLLVHNGSNSLWYSKMLLVPELDLAVLVACNRGGAAFGGKAVDDAGVELLRSFAAIASQLPRR